MLNISLIIFQLFAAVAIAASLMVVTSQNPVRAVLSLVVAFFAMSILWLLAHAEFLALVLVLVYVGAVMTLFLFVLMMLNLKFETIKLHFIQQLPVLGLMVFSFIGLLYVAVNHHSFSSELMINVASKAADYSNSRALGTALYVDYVFAFEVAGALLLLSIIAAITLTHQPSRNSKQQDIQKQISVKRKDRVRLVSMQAESRGDAES